MPTLFSSFSGECALRSPRKLDYLCERVGKNTGYGFKEGATSPFVTVRFELGSGSAASLFAWRAPQMRTYVTGWHQMFREKQEEHVDQ